MELRLELALSNTPVTGSDPNQDRVNDKKKKKKRCFEEAFSENVGAPRTLPLFIRNEPNRSGELLKEDLAVGWPPVKSWRKQLCHHNRRRCATNYVNVENSGGGGGRRRRWNYMYVKVKMEGVGIMRKLDLSTHRSYRTLFPNFASLFGLCEENVEKNYKLIYQNKEGDWLHATDVPWESFIRSVQRLKLEKNGYE